MGVLVSVFTVPAFAADCKVNDSDISNDYAGGCVNGLAHGKGRAKGRDTYEGEFKQGNKHGKGSYTWATGEKYEGDWIDDKFSGKGKVKLTERDGSVYEGDWLNGKKHGKGRITWVDGGKYVGEFRDGKRAGSGLTIWSDGSSYEGEYRDDMRNGFGIGRMVKGHKAIQRHENEAAMRGKWVDDVYVVQGLFDSSKKDGDFILSCSSPQNCKQEQAKREAQDRDRVANACNAYYQGKSIGFKPAGFSYFGSVLDAVVLGKGNGNVSIKIVDRHFTDLYGKTLEMSCTSDQLQ